MLPSFSEDATRAMRGQPKRLSRDYKRRNSGKVIVYVLISFHSRDVLCTLSRLFVRFVLVGSFGRLFGFREFNKAKFNGNGNGNEYTGCVRPGTYVIVLCSYNLCRCVQKVTKNNVK